MAKVILICGKICSGKTYLAKKFSKENNAIILSCDEIMSDLFHPNENKYHDLVIDKIKNYLSKKSVEILGAGTNVILDWGFWTKQERDEISEFYKNKGIDTEWHYVDISAKKWQENIEKRNKEVALGKTTDFPIDEGLKQKTENLFEAPTKSEINVWHSID